MNPCVTKTSEGAENEATVTLPTKPRWIYHLCFYSHCITWMEPAWKLIDLFYDCTAECTKKSFVGENFHVTKLKWCKSSAVWAPHDQTATVVVMDHHGMVSLQPAGELHLEIHICSHSQRPWNLTLSSAVTHTHTHPHTDAGPLLLLYAEGYGLEQLYFSFILTGQMAPRHTLTQTHKYTTHTCMQPSHLGSIIPFVWSSKQLANSMNYYNPVKASGVPQRGEACLSVCVSSVWPPSTI